MRKPGCTPVALPADTTQPSSEIDAKRSGPRTISSIDSGRRPMRLVNQLESGTSSSVLTFSARTSRRSPGSANVLTTKS